MDKQVRNGAFYWQLFRSTFLISAFTVGGGFVIIPLLKAKFVEEYKWLTENEAIELVAVAQAAPGVVAANASIIMGYRLAGLLGALCALAATVLPPLIIISVIAYFYSFFANNEYIRLLLKGMQCGATALIVVVMIDLLRKEIKKQLIVPLLLIAATFAANYFFDINIMYLVLLDGVIGYLALQDAKYN